MAVDPVFDRVSRFELCGDLLQRPIVRKTLDTVIDGGLFTVLVQFVIIGRGSHEQGLEFLRALAEAEPAPGIGQPCRDVHFALSRRLVELLPAQIHHIAVVGVAEEIVRGTGERFRGQFFFLVAGRVVVRVQFRFPVAVGILRQHEAVRDRARVHDAVAQHEEIFVIIIFRVAVRYLVRRDDEIAELAFITAETSGPAQIRFALRAVQIVFDRFQFGKILAHFIEARRGEPSRSLHERGDQLQTAVFVHVRHGVLHQIRLLRIRRKPEVSVLRDQLHLLRRIRRVFGHLRRRFRFFL